MLLAWGGTRRRRATGTPYLNLSDRTTDIIADVHDCSYMLMDRRPCRRCCRACGETRWPRARDTPTLNHPHINTCRLQSSTADSPDCSYHRSLDEQAATSAMPPGVGRDPPAEGDGYTYEHLAGRAEAWLDFMADTGDGGNPTCAFIESQVPSGTTNISVKQPCHPCLCQTLSALLDGRQIMQRGMARHAIDLFMRQF